MTGLFSSCWLRSDLADAVTTQLPELPAPAEGFPWTWWQAVAANGLIRISSPVSTDADGGDALSLSALAERLGRANWPAGPALAVLFEAWVAGHYFAVADGDPERTAVRDALIQGRQLVAVATSEPGVGANPKHLSTHAGRIGDTWRLSGVKSPVTHGAEAAVFLVLAVTARHAGRQQFSLFAVPRAAAGVTVENVTAPVSLWPASHARVHFSEVMLPASALLGAEGSALTEWAKPFRLGEQAFLLAYALGLSGRLGDAIAASGKVVAGELGQAMAPVAALAATLSHLAACPASDGRHEAMLTGALGQLKIAQAGLVSLARQAGLAPGDVSALQHVSFFLLRGESRGHDRLGRQLLDQTMTQGV